jgi:glyoxylase-like metal-dependent hydrolase (beta-lactamase superfamily II)
MLIRSIVAPNPGPLTLDGTSTWLLGSTAVVDPGPAISSHIHAIRQAMPALRTILITHRHADHAPGAIPLREATGARVIAPPGVLDDGVVDLRVTGGESIDVEGEGVEVIATPGHTSEHVCYLTPAGDLFSGDTVLGSGTTAIFPPDGNMADYLRSLRLLRDRAPRRICPAHGGRREDAVALIDQYIAHRLERERQILSAIDAGATSVASIRAVVYPDLDALLTRAAEVQITAHVIKLVDEGRADAALLRGATAG